MWGWRWPWPRFSLADEVRLGGHRGRGGPLLLDRCGVWRESAPEVWTDREWGRKGECRAGESDGGLAQHRQEAGSLPTRPGQPEGWTRLRVSAPLAPTHPQRLALGALEGCAPPSPHEILSTSACAYLPSSLMKCLFRSVAYFYCVDCFLLLLPTFESSLGIWICPLVDTRCADIFFQSVSHLHIYCTISFKTDIFNMITPCCPLVAFMDHTFGVISKKPLSNPRSQRIFPIFSPGSFLILGFILGLMMHFEFLYGVYRSKCISLHIDVQFNTLMWRLEDSCPFHLNKFYCTF